jgi:hypothetical protein
LLGQQLYYQAYEDAVEIVNIHTLHLLIIYK